MYLFFDTETTGLPKSWKAPVSDVNNWPRLVQLAWLLYDESGARQSGGDCIIKPAGFTIPPKIAKLHGITTEVAKAKGRPAADVLRQFETLAAQASCLVAHNLQFDESVISAELLRAGMETKPCFGKKKKICLKERATDFCAIPGTYGYKWPTLAELHQKLFGARFADAHNAATDIAATAKCFWELRRRGMI